MGKPEHKSVTEEAWRKIMPEIVARSITLLDFAEKLLDKNGNEVLCAGLYTYAVEEYGKLLLLKKYQPVNGKVEITYRDEFCDHYEKFKEASKLLSDSTILRRPIFDPAIFDPAIFDTQAVIADFEARMAIFYTDFNNMGDGIVPVPPVERNRLKIEISKLRTIITKTSIP
jgi:hypothetical protein